MISFLNFALANQGRFLTFAAIFGTGKTPVPIVSSK
jgi:hypothetical protein